MGWNGHLDKTIGTTDTSAGLTNGSFNNRTCRRANRVHSPGDRPRILIFLGLTGPSWVCQNDKNKKEI